MTFYPWYAARLIIVATLWSSTSTIPHLEKSTFVIMASDLLLQLASITLKAKRASPAAFSTGDTPLMFVTVRLKHVAESEWDSWCYPDVMLLD